MQATKPCERCGYDLPMGAAECPDCRGHIVEVTRAARQVAGVDLPTRSVHALPSVDPISEPRTRRPLRHPSGAAELLSITLLLAFLTAAGRVGAVVLNTGRFETRFAAITLDRIDFVVMILAWATLTAAGLTALAFLVRAVRVTIRKRS